MPRGSSRRSALRPNRRQKGEEYFDRSGAGRDNKFTARRGARGGSVAIFAAVSTGVPTAAISGRCARCLILFLMLAPKDSSMRRINFLLRSTRSRIGKQLSLIVAIAAASLPSAGA